VLVQKYTAHFLFGTKMTFDIGDLITVIDRETDEICQIGYIINKDNRTYAQSSWITIDWISKKEPDVRSICEEQLLDLYKEGTFRLYKASE
jgi:hypothetical protein